MKKFIFLTFFLCSLVLAFAQTGGNSIEFDDAIEHIRILDQDAFSGYNFSGDFTVEFWLKPNNVNEYTHIVSKWDLNGNRQWAVGKGGSGIAFKVSTDGTDEPTNWGPSVLSVGTWYHVAAVRSGSSLITYVNGALHRSYTGPSSINSSGTADVVIGGSLSNDAIQAARSVADEVDEVRIWNVALSQATIQNYMNQTLTDGTHPNSADLQGYWKLNETSGSTAADAVTTVNSGGTAHDGTLVNCENDEWGTSGARMWYDVESLKWDGDATNSDVSGDLTMTCTNFVNNADDFLTIGYDNDSWLYEVSGDLPSGGIEGDGNADKRLNRIWSIEGATGKEGSLSFDLNTMTGITGFLGESTDFFLLKKTTLGSAWTQKAATVSVNDQIITFGSVGSYVDLAPGYYTIGAESDATLPVELSTFNVAVTANKFVNVTWATQSETDMNIFRVLRNNTTDPSTAIVVGQRQASNTSVYTEYQIEDEDVEEGKTYYYWIESIDHANQSSLSNVQSITIRIQKDPEDEFVPEIPKKYGMTNYPNPFNPETTIVFNLKEDVQNAELEIYNILGQKIQTIHVGHISAESNEGTRWNGKDMNGTDVSSGIYFFKLNTGSKTYIRKGTLLK